MKRREFITLLGGATVEFCYLRHPLPLTSTRSTQCLSR